MISLYSGGTHRYELALTKGKIDAGESPLEAANRELIEEIGYGAKKLSFVKTMTLPIAIKPLGSSNAKSISGKGAS
jgi:ADP-ribose diphosphatase